LVRIVRMLRAVRLLRELRMMIASIMNSAMSLFWSIVLLGLVIYVFAVFFNAQVIHHCFAVGGCQGSLMLVRFGNLTEAVFTLYLSVTGGISWIEIVEILVEVHWSNRPMMVFYVFFVLFAVMNIITGFFVESAMRSAQNDKDELIYAQIAARDSELQELLKLFQEGDSDESGTISWDEFKQHLANDRVCALFRAIGLEVDEAMGLFRLLDTHRTGMLPIEELVIGCMRLKGNAKSIDLATLMYENKRYAQQWHQYFSYFKEALDSIRYWQRHVCPVTDINLRSSAQSSRD